MTLPCQGCVYAVDSVPVPNQDIQRCLIIIQILNLYDDLYYENDTNNINSILRIFWYFVGSVGIFAYTFQEIKIENAIIFYSTTEH